MTMFHAYATVLIWISCLFLFMEYGMFQRDYVACHMGTQMYSNDKKLFSTTRKGKILTLYYKKFMY